MKTLSLSKSFALLASGALLATSCVVHDVQYRDGSEVVVAGPPPAPIVETVTVAPDPAYVWIGGAWAWDGGRWGWHAGHWDRPPHRGAVWVAPRYVYRGGRHVWVRGSWR